MVPVLYSLNIYAQSSKEAFYYSRLGKFEVLGTSYFIIGMKFNFLVFIDV